MKKGTWCKRLWSDVHTEKPLCATQKSFIYREIDEINV